jgi:hypothetical protein
MKLKDNVKMRFRGTGCKAGRSSRGLQTENVKRMSRVWFRYHPFVPRLGLWRVRTGLTVPVYIITAVTVRHTFSPRYSRLFVAVVMRGINQGVKIAGERHVATSPHILDSCIYLWWMFWMLQPLAQFQFKCISSFWRTEIRWITKRKKITRQILYLEFITRVDFTDSN